MSSLSTSSCDIFWKVVSHYKTVFGERFDQIGFVGRDATVIRGAALRDAKDGCELHRRCGVPEKCLCLGFDEQLQFVSGSGVALSNIDYIAILSNGYVAEGKTDDGGRTERIRSIAATNIDRVEFFAPRNVEFCCSKTAVPPYREAIKLIHLENVQTNPNDLGCSVAKVVVKGESRPMTSGERAIAWTIFRGSIEYSKVRVHNETYLPFGLQTKDMAMTPDGELYFHPDDYLADFSTADHDIMRWFMHEMTHVWQYQLGYPVLGRGAIRIGLDYKYELSKEKRLGNFNMEAQGDLLADYYALKYLLNWEVMIRGEYRDSLNLYEEVLCDFLHDRKSQKNLPGH